MSPKISVIVPVYKAEAYLHRCVDSLLAQTFQDFEILLINDGSPDNSGEICEKYAQKDSRIKVFHQKNGGVTKARKNGIERALGKWIFFIDSDDTIEKNTLEILLDYSAKYNSDFVIGNYRQVNEHLNPLHYIYNKISSNNSIDVIREVLKNQCSGNLWGRLIYKSLFTNIYYPPREINIGEDIICGIQLINNAQNVTICPLILYNYVQQQSSVMHNLCHETVKTMPLFIKWIHNFILNNYPALTKDSSTFCLRNYYLYLINGGAFNESDFLQIYTTNTTLEKRIKFLFCTYKINVKLGNLVKRTMIVIKSKTKKYDI